MTEQRLVQSPVFVLSPIRSGSTLLRCILNSHPDICAPHELHLPHLRVGTENEYAQLALRTANLTTAELEHMLWDSVLHRFLTTSGKKLIIDKSPSNVRIWRRLLRCWPDSRFIVLRRNPAAIVNSIVRADDGRNEQQATRDVERFMNAVDEADRSPHVAARLTYEALTTEPTAICRTICDALDVAWQPAMLDYGEHDHGPFVYGIGDWSAQIRSGHIQQPGPAPSWDSLNDQLRDLCRRWNYAEPELV